MIQTVLGPISADRLGNTLVHEHMLLIDPAMRFAFPDWIDRKRLMAVAVPQLKAVKALGIDSIIDARSTKREQILRFVKRTRRGVRRDGQTDLTKNPSQSTISSFRNIPQ